MIEVDLAMMVPEVSEPISLKSVAIFLAKIDRDCGTNKLWVVISEILAKSQRMNAS